MSGEAADDAWTEQTDFLSVNLEEISSALFEQQKSNPIRHSFVNDCELDNLYMRLNVAEMLLMGLKMIPRPIIDPLKASDKVSLVSDD